MRITIITEKRVEEDTINSKIMWLSHSLGLLGERDKDSSCYRTFIELLNATRNKQQLSSDALAYRLNLSRGTVVHHLNKLREVGVLKVEEKKYVMRVGNLEELIDEIKKDVLKSLQQIQNIAKEIDDEMGL